MSTILRRTYLKTKRNVLSVGNTSNITLPSNVFTFIARTFSDDNFNAEFTNSTILIENRCNVQELPVIIRKLRDITEINDKPAIEPARSTNENPNYNLIQEEFDQCIELRDVFTLLSKCTKITPNIALVAMERINDLEKDPMSCDSSSKNIHVNVAKGAIVDKLLKVVMKTEDTQSILNALNTVSTFMQPYKYKFCDELLMRVIDNRLSVEQLCEFISYLIKNKNDSKYSDTIDKLWVGFVEREREINENNIEQIFKILPGLKVSKRTILTLLEQKLSNLWTKITVHGMQEILNVFIEEKYLSMETFAVVARWMYTNIHALDEDSLLNIITKFTSFKYTDEHVQKAVEKYMRLKQTKIKSQILIVGVLNYCMQFQIRNQSILNVCSEFFLANSNSIPHSFLKNFICPYGFLYYDPSNSSEFWSQAEKIVEAKSDKINTDDICSITLSFIYNGKYPLKLTSKLFSSEYLRKITNSETLKKLKLIDTALSLECEMYSGPLLPKDQWSDDILQDNRTKNIIDKIMDNLVAVAGGNNKVSTAVLIPHLYSDETYLIDVMLHPAGLGSNTYNWKVKSVKNENIAILIHLPDHYCSDNEQLIGPQVMKKKHLRLLGLRVVSLKYSTLSQFYTSYNSKGLKVYLQDIINNAEPCL